jgi:HEAT repeat protein
MSLTQLFMLVTLQAASLVAAAGIVARQAPPAKPAAQRTWDVAADAVQPANSPVLLTITLTNTGKEAISYWCGGPAMGYPAVPAVKVAVTDAKGNTRQLEVSNGQATAGSGLMVVVPPGKSVPIPAALAPLPAGSYTLQIGDGKRAQVTIKDDPELLKKREQDLLARAAKGEPFAGHAIAKHFSPGLAARLYNDLSAEDHETAWKAAQILHGVRDLPADAVPFLARAMRKQLALELGRQKRNTDVLVYLAILAGRIGTEEALEPILLLATSEMDGGVRGSAVGMLEMFNLERATKELHNFLKRPDEEVRLAAARVLANRHDPAAIEPLVAAAGDPKHPARWWACRALGNFPDDPRAQRAVQSRLEDPDPTVRGEAKQVLESWKQKKR